MSYEIYLSIPEESSGGHLIALLTVEEHITPSQAVERIINQVAPREIKVSLVPEREETPAELVSRLRAHKQASGKASQPPLDAKGSKDLIGMLAGNQEFSRAMDEIIAGRPNRYGFTE